MRYSRQVVKSFPLSRLRLNTVPLIPSVLRSLHNYKKLAPVTQKRFYFEQRRLMVTSVRHGITEGNINYQVRRRLPQGWTASCGEAGYFDGESVKGADVMVFKKESLTQDSALRSTPPLLIEVMSPSNLTSIGKEELKAKITAALKNQTMVVWVVFHDEVGTPGVQVHTKKDGYKETAELIVGDAELNDGGIGLKLTPNILLKEELK